MVCAKGLGVVAWVDLLGGVARLDGLAVDDAGNLDWLTLDELVNGLLESSSLLGAGLVAVLERKQSQAQKKVLGSASSVLHRFLCRDDPATHVRLIGNARDGAEAVLGDWNVGHGYGGGGVGLQEEKEEESFADSCRGLDILVAMAESSVDEVSRARRAKPRLEASEKRCWMVQTRQGSREERGGDHNGMQALSGGRRGSREGPELTTFFAVGGGGRWRLHRMLARDIGGGDRSSGGHFGRLGALVRSEHPLLSLSSQHRQKRHKNAQTVRMSSICGTELGGH